MRNTEEPTSSRTISGVPQDNIVKLALKTAKVTVYKINFVTFAL